jgi:hypothetical protein
VQKKEERRRRRKAKRTKIEDASGVGIRERPVEIHL